MNKTVYPTYSHGGSDVGNWPAVIGDASHLGAGRPISVIGAINHLSLRPAFNAMEKHDRDPVAHPNHHMTPIIQALQIEITRSLSRLEGRMENVSNEVASLRKAHDDAVSRGNCLYQQLDDKRGDR